jgi:hypothetical protein
VLPQATKPPPRHGALLAAARPAPAAGGTLVLLDAPALAAGLVRAGAALVQALVHRSGLYYVAHVSACVVTCTQAGVLKCHVGTA